MLTRREILQATTGAALLLNQAKLGKAATAKKVVVAGAGIAGLSCAWELNRAGHDVTVLEASERVGGHVKTVRADLPDGLYVDAGAEQFTVPGYDIYRSYVKEFNLAYVQDHRRENMLRWVDGRMRTEGELADPKFLSGLGYNQREVDYLKVNPWWKAQGMYLDKYGERITDEYQPFKAGMNDLDHITLTDLLKREGASPAFLQYSGGGRGSALHAVWHNGILLKREVPAWPTQVFRLVGGNDVLPQTFAQKLGAERVKLNSPVTAIRHSGKGVSVDYGTGDAKKTIEAEYLVCCMSAVMLRQIPITPAFDERKAWAVSNVPYYSATRPIFLSKSKFWQEQDTSINVEFYQPALEHIWSMADDVESKRGLITGTAQAGVNSQKPLDVFRAQYPKKDTIERAMIVDWSKDPWCLACETTSYKPGELSKFWPALIEPQGRIHFAGAYCDNLNWGQEAASRSGHRVAGEIHAA